MTDERIFEKACLLQLATKAWPGVKKLDSKKLAELGSLEWLSGGQKRLIEPTIVAPPKATVSAVRKYLDGRSCPFPIKGLNLIHKDLIQDVDDYLNEQKAVFWEQVQEVAAVYENAIAAAKPHLIRIGVYNENDYPRDITRKYDFSWHYVMIQTPGKNTILTAEVYERERQKYVDMMEEARHETALALRFELQDLVKKMVERLTSDGGEPKIFRDTLVTNFDEFFGVINERNLFDDSEITELVGKAREILKGVSPDVLRNVDAIRENVRRDMNKLQQVVSESIMDMPRRRLRLDPKMEEAA